ncbi:MAG: aldo/keto reductase [Victivallaceae bacterium]|nr:aldo/keto reductase [Victivallaceae bacterium]
MYRANDKRYENMSYRRCGQSGLKLPAISLGLWQNFGSVNIYENSRAMIHTAFDAGITHFDLANNYGPEPGSAESNFGRILAQDLKSYRDELIISSKAGYLMWPGPYGEWGSRKNLIASCDQSLKRLGLDYVDIFYHHRPDPETPLEETMGALAQIIRSGKALYAGISNYPAARAAEAFRLLREMGVRCLIHQPHYNLLTRNYEPDGLFELLEREGVGAIVFSPLAQGILSGKYLNGIPDGSRVAASSPLQELYLNPTGIAKLQKLNSIAEARGQTMAQMAIAWLLQRPAVTSTLIGASRPEQITEIIRCLEHPIFSAEEQRAIDEITGIC